MSADSSLILKMDRMIKKANQTTTLNPKVFKSLTTQEMIDDYKRSLTKPIEIDGKLYKYHPASIAVVLETPNTKYSQQTRSQMTSELYEEMKNALSNELYDLEERRDQIVDIFNVQRDEYIQDEEKINSKLRSITKKRAEYLRMSGRQKKRKGIDITNIETIIKELEEELEQKTKNIRILFSDAKRQIAEIDELKTIATERYENAGADFNQYMQEKDADEVEIKRVAEVNQKKINEYIANLKALNPRPINFSKGMNETDEQFLQRIDAEVNEEINENDDDEQNRTEALSLNRKKLLGFLDDITTNYNKKENIISDLINRDIDVDGPGEPYTDRIYEVVKFWEPIKRYIKKRYPKDTTDIKPSDYVEMMKTYLENQDEIEQSEAQAGLFEKKQEEGKKNIGEIVSYLNNDRYSVVITDYQKNILGYFKGFHGTTYPGRSKGNRILVLALSKTGEKGTFKRIDDEKKLMSFLQLSKNGYKQFKSNINDSYKAEIIEQFKADLALKGKVFIESSYKTMSFIKKIAAFLTSTYPEQDQGRLGQYENDEDGKLEGIIYEMEGKNRDKRGNILGAGMKTIRGSGVATKKPNEYQKYGDILINIKKLNRNTLAVKDDKERSIYGFPNKKISDFFVDMINMMIDNVPLNDNLYKGLEVDERIIFDQLITLAGTRKKTKKDISESIKYLKNRYNVISGSIEAGNDNPELIKDVKIILQQLYKMDQIKPKDIKDLLVNLENINK